MSFSKFDAARLYKKLRALEPNVSGALGTPPSGSAVGAVGDVVLVTGAGTTTDVLDARITNTTFMEIAPADLYGSAEKGAGNIFWSSPADGIMRITHTASTKTRTFKYLLMFGLALLLLASSAGAQVIQDNGVPLEVSPALNFFDDTIACTAGASSTDCGALGSGSGGDVMLASEWATVFGYPYVDKSAELDTNADGFPEVFCFDPLDYCCYDLNSDGLCDITFFTIGVNYDSGFFIAADGLGVGNGAAATETVSACLGRSATTSVDRLFEDKDCDFDTGQVEPEATLTGVAQTEGFLIDWLNRIPSDFTTTDGVGAGTEVTGLQLDLDWLGAYQVTYTLLSQTDVVGTGTAYSINFTGTATGQCLRTFPTNGTTATTGTMDVVNTNPGSLLEQQQTAVLSTTPNMGFADYITADESILERIDCLVVVTAAGDLELYVLSEVNGDIVRVMANSVVRATAFP